LGIYVDFCQSPTKQQKDVQSTDQDSSYYQCSNGNSNGLLLFSYAKKAIAVGQNQQKIVIPSNFIERIPTSVS
jgi:hypothetical protein